VIADRTADDIQTQTDTELQTVGWNSRVSISINSYLFTVSN